MSEHSPANRLAREFERKEVSLSQEEQRRVQAMMKDGWRLTPATMAHKITNGRWIPARHLLHISTIVATEIARGGARLILTMPARHGKSEFLSVNTPIWFLEKWPSKYVMNISYGLELATDFSLKVRDAFQNEDLHHLLRTRLRKDKLRVDRFMTTGGGGVTAAGIGGPITGRGADLMLIDDYVKNAEAALSEPQKKATWEWFKSTAYTRLEPGASLIVLATRWAQNDLIGMLLDEMPEENWRVINLPALAEANDPLGRKEGEALWPGRYSREALLKIKAALGGYWWSAMYQQRPKASMSGMDLGDKLKVCREGDLPHSSELKEGRFWDLSANEGDGDWTVGIKMAYHKESGRLFIPDLQRFQKAPHSTETMIRAIAELDGYGCRIDMEQEPGSSGKIVIDHYATKVLNGFAFKGEKATGNIVIRAQPFLASVEAGKVVMVEADWNQPLRDEVNAFPDGEFDDQVSAGALGHHKLVKSGFQGLVWGNEVGGRNRLHHGTRVQRGSRPTLGLTW